MSPEQIKLLADWEEAKKAAVAAKAIIEQEMVLRKQVVATFFADAKEGTNSAELSGGWKLKFTNSFDYKLDQAVMANVRRQLEEAGFSADRVFKYTTELVLKEYRILGDNIKPIVDAALTIKPKSPTLELIPPKES